MRFEALGPIVVISDGLSVPLRPAQRRVVASFLLDPGQWVTTETLVDRIWGESAPETARNTLHVHLSAVRDRIPGVITTGSGGYLLDLEGHSFDVPEFSARVREASACLESGDFEGASDLASRALGMWRGYPYPELDEVDEARAERARLTELSTIASTVRGRALMRGGRVAEAIAHFRGMVVDQPLDEAMWEELIRAYYLAGRQVDALEALKEVQRVLGEELGLEPGPRLRLLEEMVLTHDPALLTWDDPLDQRVERSRASPARPTPKLPSFATPFIGRDESVRRLVKLVPEQRLTTLVGVGGVGKTRMGVEAARQAAAGFPDGASFVGFDTIDDADLIPQLIAEAVSRDNVSTVDALVSAIGESESLLVLDNCEHVVDAVGSVVVDLLRRCPSVSILATSRIPLGVTGETIWPVPPMQLPDDEATASELQRNESVMFFVEAARRVNQEFALSIGNASSVAGICRSLAGIPLALELAAARCDVLTPQDLCDLLSRSGDVVSGTERDRPSRHRSIDDTVELSLGLLEPADTRLFEDMAVFAGPVGRTSMEAVCVETAGEGLVSSLRRLSHSSLITVDVGDERARYGQLPPLKQAAARRVDAERWERLRKAHMAHFLRLASTPIGAPGTDAELAWFDQIDEVIEEVRTALELSRELDPIVGLHAAVSLLPYWRWRNRIGEGRRLVSSLRAQAGEADDRAVAAALRAEGTLAILMSDLASAERLLHDALELFSGFEDKARMAVILNNLGSVALTRGDLDEALRRHADARELFSELGDRNGLGATSLNHGVVELQRENSEQARAWYLDALGEFRAVENRFEEAHAMERLSYVAHFEGNTDEARIWLEESRRLYVEAGAAAPVARVDWMRAVLALDDGDVDAASRCAVLSAQAAPSIDHEAWWMPSLLEASAAIAAGIGELNLAVVLIGAAAGFRRSTGTSRPAFANAGHQSFVESLRAQTDSRYPALLARGESMTIRQALDLTVERLDRGHARSRRLHGDRRD